MSRFTIVYGVGIIFLVIIGFYAIDWYTKYALYIEYRDALHAAAGGPSAEFDALKSQAAYFQGAATRVLNRLVDVALAFGISLGMSAIFFRFLTEKPSQ